MELFGFKITRSKKDIEADAPRTVVSPPGDDGSTTFGSEAWGYYTQTVDLEATIKNENDLIRRYRESAIYPDCDSAIQDIVNEAISTDEEEKSIDVNLDDTTFGDAVKTKVRAEFAEIVHLLNFEEEAQHFFRTWYIDGRIYFHILLDPDKPKEGIKQLIRIDPRKIRKIKNIKKKKNAKGVDVVESIEEYFLYNDKGLDTKSTTGVKLSTDSVIFVPSGLVDQNTGNVIGHLHKAVKIVNQLKMIEDSLVIYRISRAPERRIFYVDVGNLPKLKAEQYVQDIMNKYRNKITYDAVTGEVRDDKKHMSMMEDFWMPRREGGKGTEITTLAGGQNLQNLEDVQHFQQKLYQSLNVPMGRLTPSTGFSLGKSSEISRDEIKFGRFVSGLRKKFSKLFLEALRVQLIAKGIITADDWEAEKQLIKFSYIKDNHFTELKEAEILMSRLETLNAIAPYVGQYFDVEFVKKNVLRQTDEEIADMAKGMLQDRENDDPALKPSPLEQASMELQMGADMQQAAHQSDLNQQEIKVQGQNRPKPK